jgi:hypothetical protein
LPAHHIDEVVQNLDRIIDHSIANESRLGYFPALYRKVTLQVARGVSQGQFDDGDRMDSNTHLFNGGYDLESFVLCVCGTPSGFADSHRCGFSAG